MTSLELSPQQELETVQERIWDLKDQLHILEVTKAALMNVLKERRDERTEI